MRLRIAQRETSSKLKADSSRSQPARPPRRWVGRLAFAFALLLIVAAAAAILWPRPDPALLLTRAQADFQAGRYESARARLQRLERIRPPTAMDHMARAQVAWGLKHGDEALAELSRIPENDPLSPLAHLLAGQIEMKQGRLRPAEADFLATLKTEPKAVQAHRELIYLYNIQHRQAELDAHLHALSELGALDYDMLLHWGKTRNVVWKADQDSVALASYIAADPDDRYSRLALADGLRQLGRLDQAEEVLKPLPSSDAAARARRAMLGLERGDEERTRRLVDEGPPNDPALARVRGLLAIKRGAARAAVEQFRLALKANPTDRSVLIGMATALKILGDNEAARPYLDAVKKHDALTPLISRASTLEGKKDPRTPYTLASACEFAGRLYEALAWYRMAVAKNPLDAEAQQGVFRLSRKIAELPGSSRQ